MIDSTRCHPSGRQALSAAGDRKAFRIHVLRVSLLNRAYAFWQKSAEADHDAGDDVVSTKTLEQDVEVEDHFAKLRGNPVFAELASAQRAVIAERPENSEALAEDLRVNLEVQEQA